MSSRPTSRTSAGDDNTTALRNSTAKRPLTKPVAPRLSTSTTATRPTSTSSARTSTVASSNLSKPPTRPTATTSASRRPLSSATTAAGSLHRARPSSASVDASGDEAKRDGITAKPKRMSLASTASATRTSTLSSRTPAATPLRKPTSAASTSSVRPTVKSPTAVTKAPSAATIRSTPTASRTRPLSAITSSTTRGVNSLADRKRLSTIPASPAVSGRVEDHDEDKENDDLSEAEHKPVRPALGTRKSTRSVLIEQRIHEFELVNQMLHSAMTADGIDSEEEGQIQQEARNTIAKLRMDLAKAREFEKEHGRLPSEAELAEMDDAEVEGLLSTEDEDANVAAQGEITGLKKDLEDSYNEIETLKRHLSELNSRMEYFGQTAEAESKKVEEATEAIRAEHTAKIEEMMTLQESQLEEMKSLHQDELNELAREHKSDIEAMEAQQNSDSTNKDAELEALKLELEIAKRKRKSAAAPQVAHDRSASESSELEEVRKQLKATQDRHQAAKDNAKSKIAKAQQEYGRETAQLRSQHADELAMLQEQLDIAQKSSDAYDVEIAREKETHAETLQQVQTLRNELEGLKSSKSNDSQEYQKTIDRLQGKYNELEKLKSEEVKNAEASAKAMSAESEEQFHKLRTQLKAAQTEIETNTNLSEKHYSEALQKTNDDLEAAQDQLASTMKSHAESQKNFEVQLQKAEEAASAAANTHRTEIEDLQQRVKEAESKAADHAKHLESVQLKLKSGDSEVDAVKQAHAKELSKARAEADQSHQQAIESLKKTHANQVAQLEERFKSTSEELEGMKTANTTQLEKATADATAAQQIALKEQATTHQSLVSQLEDKLASLQKDLNSHETSHEDVVRELKAEHTKEKDVAISELTALHEKKIEELTSQSKASADAVKALEASHADSISKAESQAKSAGDELDAAKFQVQSLKGILQSIERENEEKAREYQQELDKKDEDFSQAITKLSSQSMRVAELETAHRQAVEQAKAAVEVETQASLDALKHEHDEALETLRRELEGKHQTVLQSLQSEHSNAMDLLTKQIDSHDHDIIGMQDDHARALAELKTSAQHENDKALDNLKSDHQAALDSLKSTLQQSHDTSIKTLQEQHSSEMAKSIKEHNDSLENVRKEHADLVTTLQADLEQIQNKVQDTSEVDTLKSQLSASQQALAKLQEEQANTMSTISKEHTGEITKLEVEIKVLQDQARQLADTTELDNLKSELATAKGEVSDLINSHAEVIGKKDLEHMTSIKTLQFELDEAKAAVASSVQDAAEAEEMKGLLADAKRTVTELSEQYALASADAESQRIAAENAKKELADLKKSISEAKLASEVSPQSKSLHVETTNGTAKTSPKPGLKASKWASTEAEPASATTESPTTPSSTPKEPKTSKNRRKSRNVAGQMVGIKEQLRQLTEMDDEMLEDHRKWARTLNRVDEDGTVTLPKTGEIGGGTETPEAAK